MYHKQHCVTPDFDQYEAEIQLVFVYLGLSRKIQQQQKGQIIIAIGLFSNYYRTENYLQSVKICKTFSLQNVLYSLAA